MDLKEKLKVLNEKMRYLYNSSLKPNKIDVIDIDIDFDAIIKKDRLEIDGYDVFIHFDYLGELDGFEPNLFSGGIVSICNIIYDSVSEYIVLSNGSIKKEPKGITVSEPVILQFDYKMDDTKRFKVAIKVSYE